MPGTDEHPHSDLDIDLSTVIAESISTLAHQDHPHHDDVLQKHADLQSDLPQNHFEDQHQDLDLESAIGDVFSQFDFAKQESEVASSSAEHPLQSEELKEHKPENEQLQDAKSQEDTNQYQSQDAKSQEDTHQYQEDTHQYLEPLGDQPHAFTKELSEEALDEAIGNAFQSAINDTNEPEGAHDTNTQDDDANLDEAIGDAFKNLLGGHEAGDSYAENHQPQESPRPVHDNGPDQPDNTVSKSEQPQTDVSNPNPEQAHHYEVRLAQDTNSQDNNHESQLPTETQDEDNSLQDAIGNAFNDIFQENQSKPPEQNEQKQQLAEAIDSVLENLISQLSSPTSQNKAEEDYSMDNDLDLDAAIGDAFKSILPSGEAQKENTQHSESNTHTEAVEQPKATNEEDKGQEEDLDLENAIGEAFKSLTAQSDAPQAPAEPAPPVTTENELDDDELSAMISASFKKVMDKPENSQPAEGNSEVTENSNTSISDDKFMESAITEAFMSAMQNSDSAIKIPTSELQSERRMSEGTVDLSRLVQNLVTQMATQEETLVSEKLPISQDVLKELALEITSQVQDHLTEDDVVKKQNTMTDLPQIEDNVLAHFQNEAHKDERWSKKEATKSKINPTALAQVVRNAIRTTDSQADRHGSVSHEPTDAELDKLLMNDIIQNAFNMAMENPHELLSDLEIDEEVPLSGRSALPLNTSTFSRTRPPESSTIQPRQGQSSELYNASRNRVPGSNNISATYGKSGEITNSNRDLGTGKSLSIAETLALHRSSMNIGPRRDYSTIESLEEALKSSRSSNEPIRSQISSVIHSINSRMNNNRVRSSNDSDFLGAIQQMTNMLTSDSSINNSALLSILRETPSVTEIISTYKEIEDKENMVNSLFLTKSYLSKHSSSSSDNIRAISLIDKVIQEFNQSTDAIIGRTSLSHLPNIKSEVISNISRSVVSAISNYSSSHKLNRTTISTNDQVKEEEDMREKIRLENRARKKRWREENSERNKDNDLRSRVWRRAAILFGEKDTPEKKEWADKEFEKRRDKRIARREKQTVKSEPEEPVSNEKEEDLVNDPKFIKPVTDIFNIVSSFTNHEDPQAALAATSAATATMAAVYATGNKFTDFEKVDSAVSTILANIMRKIDTVGQHQRMASLTKGISSNYDPNIYRTKLDKPLMGTPARKPAMKRPTSEPNSYEKRKPEDTLNNELKKSKLDTGDRTRIPDTSITAPSPWSTPVLKMPHYKNPEGFSYGPKRFASTSSAPSPFISNKANFGMDKGASKPISTGLRKPGSFQRPISKPERKGFGAPPVHSTL
ncbi:uncharacterized protein CANTADRAFT_5616 [Suhomyces tanzawaensis NRRL Y-17324]|uniref:DUF3020 domain-containing protein n=1 Tax=Suhomyces tanzawaensis NRRL Y-17324 TaxID=984487 RepID=A0A1E4SK96_9ASCO|nr:uncharacterized protein CANTADRAFT_5616 [Suhomyces tanzawaensis NRRL Y-17324]ODV79924.1 hypothetical protein CANTADRAFT_5616 [Suhomyces tanzawaensis NRRL Y-17324]